MSGTGVGASPTWTRVPDTGSLYSIGHSNTDVDAFLDLLERHRIEVVADVRSSPFSRHAPHFNREQLKRALANRQVGYVYMGDELGGRPSDSRMYDEEHHVRYDLLASSDPFRVAMERLANGAHDYRVAVMCGEEDPTSCHRRRLIGRAGVDWGLVMSHIRGDGSVQTEEQVVSEEAVRFPARFQLSLIEPELWRSVHPIAADPKS
jgi:uncharacterized protein (DUF488 family)